VRAIEKLAILAAATMVFAATASAATHPHERNGFMIGFGLGGGSGTIEDADDREGGGVGNFRIGYAVRQDLVIHFEGSAWTRTWDEGPAELTATLSTNTAALTYYPPGSGLFLRGGIGFGTARFELEQNNVTVSTDETGLGLLVGAGYEWRLTQKFALGPHVEFNYQKLDDLESANVISGVLDLNWYW
jgi:opacity protein-like surface antigen